MSVSRDACAHVGSTLALCVLVTPRCWLRGGPREAGCEGVPCVCVWELRKLRRQFARWLAAGPPLCRRVSGGGVSTLEVGTGRWRGASRVAKPSFARLGSDRQPSAPRVERGPEPGVRSGNV